MFLLTSIVTKPPHMSVDEFRTWWTHTQAPLVAATPGLRHYVICPADAGVDLATGKLATPPPYDGVAMLWFDSEADVNALLASIETSGDGSSLPLAGMHVVSLAGTPIVHA